MKSLEQLHEKMAESWLGKIIISGISIEYVEFYRENSCSYFKLVIHEGREIIIRYNDSQLDISKL